MEHNAKLNSDEIDELFSAILLLETQDDCSRFFEDICTISELKAIAQRFCVARMLDKKITYQEISQKTGASTATISRVNRCLQYGAGGYRLVLDRMKDE